MGLYQLININYEAIKKSFKPPRVCDISPGVTVQVINVANIDIAAMEQAFRSGPTWDAATTAAVTNSVGREAVAG